MEENITNEVKRLSEILAKDPDSIVFASLADLYLEMEMADEAIKMCLSGLKNHPNYLRGHSVLAEAYLAKGMVHSAKGEYERITELNPSDEAAKAKIESRFWEKHKPPTGMPEARLEPEVEETEELAEVTAEEERIEVETTAPVEEETEELAEVTAEEERIEVETTAPVEEETEELAEVTAEEERIEVETTAPVEEEMEELAEVTLEEAEVELEASAEEERAEEPEGAPIAEEGVEAAVETSLEQKIQELVRAAYEEGMEEALRTPLGEEEIEEALKTGFSLGKRIAGPETKEDKAATSAINALIRSFQEIRKEHETPAAPPVEAEATMLSAIDRALSDLLQKPGVNAAILIDATGLIVDSASSPGTDAEEAAALASMIFSSSQKTMESLNLGKVDRIAIERSDRRVYMTRAGEHILMVETDMSIRLGLLSVLVKKISQAFRELTE